MKTQEQEIITDLGFRDISSSLKTKTLEILKKHDVVSDINLDSERLEMHHGKPAKIYNFNSQKYNLKGRIFPMDEIITLNQKYDIIIQNWKITTNPINVDAQIYHDLYQGEKLKVNVSRMPPPHDPSFKIFNHISCFIKDLGDHHIYRHISLGSRLLVEVDHWQKKGSQIHAFVKPLDLLKDYE